MTNAFLTNDCRLDKLRDKPGVFEARALPAGSFFGRSTRSFSVNGFRLNELVYPKNFSGTPPHCHEYSMLKIILSGAYTHGWGSFKSKVSSAWTLDYCPAGLDHWHHSHQSEVRVLAIEIEPSRFEIMGVKSRALQSPTSLQGERCRWLLVNLQKAFHELDPISAMEVEGYVLVLLSELTREGPGKLRKPLWLRQARELIHSRFKEQLSITEIAHAVGVHPVWLASDFRRNYRQTVGEMIRELRVNYASEQLRHTDMPLSAVALDAGFSDQSHFSNVFRRITGMTPRQFRLAMRVPDPDSGII
jgi:AraC family transcriptional regulator